jgi:hypothetical protein
MAACFCWFQLRGLKLKGFFKVLGNHVVKKVLKGNFILQSNQRGLVEVFWQNEVWKKVLKLCWNLEATTHFSS